MKSLYRKHKHFEYLLTPSYTANVNFKQPLCYCLLWTVWKSAKTCIQAYCVRGLNAKLDKYDDTLLLPGALQGAAVHRVPAEGAELKLTLAVWTTTSVGTLT